MKHYPNYSIQIYIGIVMIMYYISVMLRVDELCASGKLFMSKIYILFMFLIFIAYTIYNIWVEGK